MAAGAYLALRLTSLSLGVQAARVVLTPFKRPGVVRSGCKISLVSAGIIRCNRVTKSTRAILPPQLPCGPCLRPQTMHGVFVVIDANHLSKRESERRPRLTFQACTAYSAPPQREQPEAKMCDASREWHGRKGTCGNSPAMEGIWE